jgi:AraC-like DNA-binding protein
LLLHDFSDTGDMWEPLAEVLVKDHTVMIPDLRGMGLSCHPESGDEKTAQAKNVAGILDHLKVQKVDLVTHDIGNMVGYALAYLFVNGSDPRRILLMTFSRRAAREMARRVERICADVLGPNAGIMTATLELDAKSDRVQTALAFARKNLREPLTVERLAEAARLSPRQLSRVFRAETGQSPAQAIENLRLEAARFMLEQGRLPVAEIARETGFGDRERMRRSFQRTFGQAPQTIRNASRPLATF